MITKVSSKSKLLVPTFSLIILLLIFGVIIIISSYLKIVSLSELNEKVVFSTMVSRTLHALQKERGLSSGYAANKNSKFQNELIKQRNYTDLEIKNLTKYLDEISCKKFKNENQKILPILKSIIHIRTEMDNILLTSDKVISKYSYINFMLLDIIVNIAKSSHIPVITQNMLAYVNFLYLKENTGIERAQGVIILSRETIDIKSLIYFTNLIAMQNQNQIMFFKYASSRMKKIYNINIKRSFFKKVENIEKMIVNNKSEQFSVDPKVWYDLVTKELNVYDIIGQYIKDDTKNKIQLELKNAEEFFFLILGLIIISLIIFIFMLIAFLKLAKEEQRLRIVMDKYIISSITDLNGIITDVSEAFCNISGYKKEELIGKKHNIIRHPDMPNKVFKTLWYNITRGNTWKGKVKNKKKDGGFYWVYAHVEPLYNGNRNVDSYISIRLDITENELLMLKIQEEEEKNKVHEELMQQQYRLAQMGEMLSMIAHQWRQPLSAITAATGSINLKVKLNKLDDKTALMLSNKIKEFSLHLSSTIDDFRNFFKSNKQINETNYINIIDSVLLIIESSLEINNIKLIKNIKIVEELNTYENEIKQVLLNLMKNAEDALLEKNIKNPEIIIEVDKKTIIVRDNAGGIPENIIDKIFEPYFSTKIKKDGTGLGLYMSKLIVQDHCGGSLEAYNDEYGAVFKITLGEDNG